MVKARKGEKLETYQKVGIFMLIVVISGFVGWVILTLAISLFVVVMVDDITNLTLKNLRLPTAQNFYEAIGWKFK